MTIRKDLLVAIKNLLGSYCSQIISPFSSAVEYCVVSSSLCPHSFGTSLPLSFLQTHTHTGHRLTCSFLVPAALCACDANPWSCPSYYAVLSLCVSLPLSPPSLSLSLCLFLSFSLSFLRSILSLMCSMNSDILSHAQSKCLTAASELKKTFFNHLDRIIDEKYLLGPARHQSLRPLANSMIVEYLQGMREQLSVAQVIRPPIYPTDLRAMQALGWDAHCTAARLRPSPAVP